MLIFFKPQAGWHAAGVAAAGVEASHSAVRGAARDAAAGRVEQIVCCRWPCWEVRRANTAASPASRESAIRMCWQMSSEGSASGTIL